MKRKIKTPAKTQVEMQPETPAEAQAEMQAATPTDTPDEAPVDAPAGAPSAKLDTKNLVHQPPTPESAEDDISVTERLVESDLDAIAKKIGAGKLSPDMKKWIASMTIREARLLVSNHWQCVRKHVAVGNQVQSLERGDALGQGKELNHSVLDWYHANTKAQDKILLASMKYYAEQNEMGRWCMETTGIGFGMAATLIAFIDPEKAITAGSVYSICGVNPQQVWLGAEKAKDWVDSQKGTPLQILARASEVFHRRYDSMYRYASTDREGKPVKVTRERVCTTLALRPYNANLKVLVSMIGASFVRTHKLASASPYSRMYVQRKAYETAKNERGEYAELAAAILARKKDHKNKPYYAKGMLPPLHIENRCRRYAAKQFLSDFQQALYRWHFKQEPPAPYPIARLGHAHIRIAPNGPLPHGALPGLAEPLGYAESPESAKAPESTKTETPDQT